MTWIIMFTLQVTYIVVKFISIRVIVSNVLYNKLFITMAANLVWLITTTYGVGNMIKENYLIVIPYMLGSLVGVLIENKLRSKNEIKNG